MTWKQDISYTLPTAKKAVVYEFIDRVGMDWMSSVKAVACDMNSDYEEAFLERCPHLKIIFDFFHIKKNFNDINL